MAGIFPFLNPVPKQQSRELEVFREYDWDFENNQMKLLNGAPVVVERKEALKVWIFKALTTPRYRYLGYTWNYGHELEELIGSNYSPRVTQAEAERFIREALLVSPYITAVPGVEVQFIGDVLSIGVKVETVYGEVEVHV
ncbi:DUF2634 domain-containing protein [Gorillibacterium sp. sgz5001074]|uniref:DUF2634 domain-containing protein n=1 Tax=Gorillibacterium sp. sgz5001074 TaxID=3446695 RepID=UPI003F67E57D